MPTLLCFTLYETSNLKLKAPNLVPTKYRNIKIPLESKKTEFFSGKNSVFSSNANTVMLYNVRNFKLETQGSTLEVTVQNEKL